jgi:RHS repeat-associated protein
VKNHLGSVRLVVKAATGQVAQRLDYDAWGNVTLDTNPGFQPFGFAGGVYDGDTKLTHFGYRDYDAESGTWTAKGPIRLVGGFGVYVYGLNNPLRNTDRTGLEPDAFLSVHEALRLCGGVGCTPAQFQSEVQEFQQDALKVFIADVIAYAALEAAAAKGPALCGAGKRLWDNLSFDGPSPGVWHASGRIFGVRWKRSQWGARLDLDPLPGSPNPILHINFGPPARGEAAHVRLWDPVQWWSSP